MIKCVVGGQKDKQLIKELLTKHGRNKLSIEIKSDLDAAVAMQTGEYSYYFGACATGIGGALAITMALLGADKCSSVSIPGKVMTDDEIINEIKAGKVAFGFVSSDAEKIIPVLMESIFNEVSNL